MIGGLQNAYNEEVRLEGRVKGYYNNIVKVFSGYKANRIEST